MQRKFIVGNWKMNGALSSNESLLKEVVGGLAQMSTARCAFPSRILHKSRHCYAGHP